MKKKKIHKLYDQLFPQYPNRTLIFWKIFIVVTVQ